MRRALHLTLLCALASCGDERLGLLGKCSGSDCATACTRGATSCDGACVQLTSNAAHCGECGRACATGTVCSSGRCLQRCDRTLYFAPADHGSVDGEPQVAGDFNGDGALDLLVELDAGETAPPDERFCLGVMLNDGHGLLRDRVAGYHCGPTRRARQIAAAEVNRDGKLDVLILDPGSSLTLLLGENDGTFREGPSSYPLPTSGTALAVFDMNVDGATDVLVPLKDGTAALFLGSSLGALAPLSLSLEGAAGPIATAFFDDDALPDLAIGVGTEVVVLRGIGAGFEQIARVETGRGSLTSVAVVDFDGDGQLDLLVGNEPDRFRVLKGSEDGRVFAELDPLRASAPVGGSVISDFDGDGLPDLAYVSREWLAISINAGPVSLTAPLIFRTNWVSFPVPDAAPRFAVADFNLDGRLDVALTGARGHLDLRFGRCD